MRPSGSFRPVDGSDKRPRETWSGSSCTITRDTATADSGGSGDRLSSYIIPYHLTRGSVCIEVRRYNPRIRWSGLGRVAKSGDSEPIAASLWIAKVAVMVHDSPEVLRHRRTVPCASTEQGDRRMTSGGLDSCPR